MNASERQCLSLDFYHGRLVEHRAEPLGGRSGGGFGHCIHRHGSAS